jgi:hypothetical protein
MDSAIKRKTLEQLTEKIGFTPQYQSLLHYLVESSIKNVKPDEMSIAKDVFNRDDSYDPTQDTLVRVYISNLRKKLTTYYTKEGKNDKVKLSIPRGKYELKFVQSEPSYKFNKKYLVYGAVALLLAISLFFIHQLLFSTPQNNMAPQTSHHIIWKNFFKNSKLPKTILSSPFLFQLDSPSVNMSPTPLFQSPDDAPIQYPIPIQHFTDQTSIHALNQLLPVYPHLRTLDIKLSSELSWQDIKNHNIVYIGTLYGLGKLHSFLNLTHFELDLDEQAIRMNSTQTDSAVSYTCIAQDQYRKDYALIAKTKGINKNSVLIISGFRYHATLEAIRKMTDLAFLNSLSDSLHSKFKNSPKYFSLVLQVEGISESNNHTSLNAKIVSIQKNKPYSQDLEALFK